jgi:DNA-binding NarL/FixJ family response regulator
MRVLVFSSIRLFGDGLAACLQSDEGIEAASVCCRSDAMIDEVIGFAADIVLVDVAGEDGIQHGRLLAAALPEIPIVALALAEDSAGVIACADAGFVSYVPRDAPISELRGIIEMASRGEVACNPKVSGSLLRELWLRRLRASRESDQEPLTRRESEVLRLVLRGLSNKQIARTLTIADATIKNHVHNILAKLHVRRRAEAVERVRREPWIARSG